MNEDEVLQALASRLPSDRMAAAAWLSQHGVQESIRPAVAAAASREGVPRIRSVLHTSLRGSAPLAAAGAGREEGSGQASSSVLAELGTLIQHEMQPAIGWVRYAAHGDITDFEDSATNRAIEALRRRVDGLVQLADAHRPPVRRRASLVELLQWSVPKDNEDLFVFEAPEEVDDSINTDGGLFTLLVSNAMQNAVDAVAATSAATSIFVTVGVSQERFWVAIVNRQPGANWRFSDVGATGISTKAHKRGLGTRVMDLAAARLGYDFDLHANGGTVTFTIKGSRIG